MEDVQEVDTKLLEISLVSDTPSAHRLYVIVDTNILLSNHSLLEKLRAMPRTFDIDMIIIVPWIVVNELDKLKTSTLEQTSSKGRTVNVGSLARKATNTLLAAQMSGDLFYRGETLMEYKKGKQMTKDFGLTTNDDKVLQSCMYFGKQFLESPGGCIILLSNDKNLLLRARTNGIHAVDGNGLSATRESVDSARLQAIRQEDLFKSAMGFQSASPQISSGSSQLYQPPLQQHVHTPSESRIVLDTPNVTNRMEVDSMMIDQAPDEHWGYKANANKDSKPPHVLVAKPTIDSGGPSHATNSSQIHRSRDADSMQIVRSSHFEPRRRGSRAAMPVPNNFQGRGRVPRAQFEVEIVSMASECTALDEHVKS